MLLLNINLNDDLALIRKELNYIIQKIKEQNLDIKKFQDLSESLPFSIEDIRSNSYINYSQEYWVKRIKEELEKIL